jgi:hypothetical protein
MRTIRRATFVAAAACAASLLAAPAFAVTFAQTIQDSPADSTFFFTNNGDGTSTISGSGQAALLFTSDPPLFLAGTQIADFTYTATSTHQAEDVGLTYQQIVDSGTLTFTNSLGNLLTVNFTNGLIGGRDGGVSLWGGDDSSIGASVTYTSDFDTPDFSLFGDTENFMLALTLNPTGTGLSLGANNQLASFEASAAGTFRTGAGAIPEPASWAMMIIGFGGVGALLRRRSGTAFA